MKRKGNEKMFINRIIVFLFLMIIPILIVDYYVDSYASFRITYNKIGKISLESNYCVGKDIPVSERKSKWATLNYMDNADYIILGSSRSMLFSSKNLGIDSLYNLGVSGGCTVNDYLAEVYILYQNKKLPQYMLIEISPYIFNSKLEEQRWKEWGNNAEYMRCILNGENIHYDDSALLGVQIKDIISPSYFKYNLNQLQEKKRVYIEVSNNDENEKLTTWHIDGSISYSIEFQNKNNDEVIIRNIKSICDNKTIYGCSDFDMIDGELVNDFCELLLFLKENNVEVSFYLPPYSKPMYNYISEEVAYNTIIDVEDWVINYGRDNHIQVYGSYDPTYCNVEISDLYDEYHIKDYKIRDTLWARDENLSKDWIK